MVYSSVLHLPKLTAPAAFSRAVVVLSKGGTYVLSRNMFEQAVVGTPFSQ